MNKLDEAPPLNPWPFILGDVVLLGAAVWISLSSPSPLHGAPLLAVAGCVALGSVLACVPFLLNYTRRQDRALAERQNEIAALARTTAESAEQLGIAATGLHTIADTASRALKHADQLPHKLQEKINEFKTQLNEVNVTENVALEEEINTLRTSEVERLEAVMTNVRKMVAELSTLDAATRQHLADFKNALAEHHTSATRLSTELGSTLARQQADWEQRLASAFESFEKRLAGSAAHPVAPPPTSANSHSDVAPSAAPSPATAKPFRTRHTAHSSAPYSPSEPPPTSERPPEVSPVTADPFPAVSSVAVATAAELATSRKRPPRKTSAAFDDQPSLGLDLATDGGEFSQLSPDETSPGASLSTDGLTRLLVTAYIGIGNKLYLRGDGPGLSWEKGAPLQFVSIGKWRWETADAQQPLTLKLYKNDEDECTSLGAVTLAPGHQQEVRANF